MGLDIFRWLKFRKKLEPENIAMIKSLERRVGPTGQNNVSAMQNYIETITSLEKDYDISEYEPTVDLYKSLLNNQKKNSSK